ncbi:MAG: heparinase II/III family protein [Litorimonas sp.]
MMWRFIIPTSLMPVCFVSASLGLAAGLTGCGASNVNSDTNSAAVQIDQATYAARFETTLETAIQTVRSHMELPLNIPVPKDAGGGYTHETHKQNAKIIYDAGALYQLTGEREYADFAIKMMRAYADVYPDWGSHPAKKEQSPGRMFWQNLNESWWLVHVAQGYGAVLDVVNAEDKVHIETQLLRNMADFLSQGSPETFDKIHNHGTWATAAVGMTGYIIGDKEYSDKALLGLDKSGQAGFLKQLDLLFSPDGYYNEGPYYQRYALMPFVLFGQAIAKNEPERDIFNYRDEILKKAIYTTIHSNYNGLFFPINDAIKDKGIATTELLYGVSIAYDLTGDEGLLSVAQAQGAFVLTPESRKLSNDIQAGLTKPFPYQSMRLRDGQNGNQGALDILRASNDPKGLAVIAKNTSQGLGHGHFDKLGLLVYDRGHEVVRDYGAARFLNIEAKFGGHYLAENNSYAKQSIAHNTLIVDETSHFDGVTAKGNLYAPETGTFQTSDTLKVTTAKIDTAYKGVEMTRTTALVTDRAFSAPIIVDVMSASSDASHQYDLPFHYNGQLVETNFPVQADPVTRSPLGPDNGYQHLWKLAETRPGKTLSQVTWLLDKRFYTVSSALPENSVVIFAEVGANDPNLNLRRESAFILRVQSDDGLRFVSVIESHGEYNPTLEYTRASHSHVKTVTQTSGEDAVYIHITTQDGQELGLGISPNMAPDRPHDVNYDGVTKTWRGPYHLFHSSEHQGGTP